MDLRSNDPVKPLATVPVTMTVTPTPNTAPVPSASVVTTNEDTPITITLSASDKENDPLYYAIKTLPAKGVLRLTNADHTVLTSAMLPFPLGFQGMGSTNQVIYEPPPDVSGTSFASFTWFVEDYRLTSAVVTTKINVISVPDPPHAVEDLVVLAAPIAQPKIVVLANDSDIDGDKLSVVAVTQPTHGTVSINADSTLNYVPAPTFVMGEDAFTYAVQDATGQTSNATVYASIGPLAGGEWSTYMGNNARTGYRPGKLFGKLPVLAWTASLGPYVKPAVIARGQVVAMSRDANANTVTCTALDAVSGATLWARSFSSAHAFTIPSLFADQVYLELRGGTTQEVRALSALDGSDLWSVPVPYSNYLAEGLAVDETSVYVSQASGGNSNSLRVLNRFDGSLRMETGRWSSSYEVTAPCVLGKEFYQMNNGVGQLWDVDTGFLVSNSPVISSSSRQSIAAPGGIIYQTYSTYWSPLGRILPSVNPGSVTISSQGNYYTNPAIAGSQVCASSLTGVDFFDLSTAKKLNTVSLQPFRLTGQPLLIDDAAVVTVSNNNVYPTANESRIYERATGRLITTIPDSPGTWSSAGGILLLTGATGTLKAYRAYDPTLGGVIAESQTVTTSEDTSIPVTLGVVSPNGTPRRIVTALPAKGTLYQTSDGSTRGIAITAAPSVVSNPNGTLIYAPALDDTATRNFKFIASDGTYASANGTVGVQITPVNDEPSAVNDVVVLEPGTVTSIQPALNDIDPDNDELQVTSFTQPTQWVTVTRINDNTLSLTAAEGLEGRTTQFDYTVTDAGGLTSTATVFVSLEGATTAAWPTVGNTSANTRYYPGTLGGGTMRELWKFPANSWNSGAMGVIAAEGKAFIATSSPETYGSQPNQIVAVDLHSGGELWRSDATTLPGSIGLPSYFQGRLVMPAYNGTSDARRTLAALDSNTGALAWRNMSAISVPQNLNASPAVSAVGIIANGEYGSQTGLVSVGPSTGELRFGVTDAAYGGYWSAWPSCVLGRIFCTDGVGRLSERDTRTGGPLWSYTVSLGSSSVQALPPLIVGRRAIQTDGPRVWAVDIDTHLQVWMLTSTSSAVPLMCASPTALYLATDAGTTTTVRVVNPVTGVLIDTFSLAGYTNYKVAVTQDWLFLLSYNKLSTYDLTDHTAGPTFSTGISPTQIAIAEGRVLVAYPGNSVRAYGLPPPNNHAPTAAVQTLTIDEEGSVTVTLSASDTDGDSLDYVVSSLPATGRLYKTSDGVTKGSWISSVPTKVTDPEHRVIYEGELDVFGANKGSFDFTAYDQVSASASAKVSIDIANINDAPVATPDHYALRLGEVLDGFRPQDNDRDFDGDLLTITSFTQPAHGDVAVYGAVLSYTPPNNVSASIETFEYTITDAAGATSTATVTLEIGSDLATAWATRGANFARTSYVPIALGTAPFTKQWSSSSMGTINSVIAARGRVFLNSWERNNSSVLRGLDLGTGAPFWSTVFNTSTYYYNNGWPSWRDGRLYVDSTEGSQSGLRCFDGTLGAILWKTPGDTSTSYSGAKPAPAVDDTNVWFSLGSSLAAKVAENGGATFSQNLPGLGGSSIALWQDRMFTTQGGNVIELNPLDGTTLWALSLAGSFSYRSMLVAESGVLALLIDDRLFVIDANTHSVLWSERNKQRVDPAIGHGSVFCAGYRCMEQHDLRSGRLLRKYPSSASYYDYDQPPIVSADLLIATSGFSARITDVYDLATGNLRQTINHSQASGSQVNSVALCGRTLLVVEGSQNLTSYQTTDNWNQVPTVTNLLGTTNEDTDILLTLSATDPDGEALNYAIATLPANGRLFQTSDGRSRSGEITAAQTIVTSPSHQVIYVPPSDQFGLGLGSFTYRASDGQTQSLAGMVTLDVVSAPDAPEAVADRFEVTAGETLSPLPVLMNDYDIDGTAPTIASVGVPTYGSSAINTDGTLRYTAPANITGLNGDDFDYTITDGTAVSAGHVSIVFSTVSGANWPMFGNTSEHAGIQPNFKASGTWMQRWQSPVNSTTGNLAVAEGLVLMPSSYANAPLVALRIASGVEAWRGPYSAVTPAWAEGRVFGQNYTNAGIFALSDQTGGLVWASAGPSSLSTGGAPLSIRSGLVYGNGNNGELISIDAHLGGSIASTPPVSYNYATKRGPTACAYGVLSLQGGRFTAYNAELGAELWSIALGTVESEDNYSKPTIAVQGHLAFLTGLNGNSLYAIDIKRRGIAWRILGAFRGDPAVAGDLVYVQTNASLEERRILDGTLVRTTPTFSGGLHQPLVTPNFILIENGTQIKLLDRASGTVQQTLSVPGNPSAYMRPVAANDSFFVPVTSMAVVCLSPPAVLTLTPSNGSFSTSKNIRLDALNSSTVIRYTTDGSAPKLSSPSIASGGTVLMNQSGKVRAIAVVGSDVSRIYEGSYTIAAAAPLAIRQASSLKTRSTPPTSPIDSDHDGQTDSAEALAGTDPDNAADFFHTCGCERLADGKIRISWPGKLGHGYVVECSTDLQTWSPVSASLEGTDGVMSFDALATGDRCFLRVRLEELVK